MNLRKRQETKSTKGATTDRVTVVETNKVFKKANVN